MASPTEHSLVQTPCAITFTNLAEGLQRATEALASLTAEKRKFASKVLRDTEALVQQRRKEVARWERTSLALQKTYAHKVRTHSFDLESLDASHAALQDEVDTHQRTRHRLESSLEQLDSDLAHARSEALRTAIKKRRRERNLNHYYFVPLFARYFKHKYVRSQTKNARWEDRVRELRTIADDSRAAMHAAGLRLAQIQKESVELDSQRQEAASRAASIQALLTFLSEGTEFWSDIASVQCEGVVRVGRALRTAIERTDRDLVSPRMAEEFRMACLDLSEGDEFARGRWAGVEVEFVCARCGEEKKEWPGVTKEKPDELLCGGCYIVRKKDLARVIKRNVREIGGGREAAGAMVGLPAPGSRSRSASALLGNGADVKQALKSAFSRSTSALLGSSGLMGSNESRLSLGGNVGASVLTNEANGSRVSLGGKVGASMFTSEANRSRVSLGGKVGASMLASEANGSRISLSERVGISVPVDLNKSLPPIRQR